MTAAAGLEIELKLDLDAGTIDALIAAPDLAQAEWRTAVLFATYFDTPDRALDHAGVSLRVRREGERRVQTVKAAGAASAGLFARPEWERDVPGDAPELDASAGPLASLFPADVLATVAPAFTVAVTRRSARFCHGDAEIEMVIDDGTIAAGEARAPVAEIELELKAGPPDALFALARALDLAAPLRTGVLSKSERGYLLLSGAAQKAVKGASAKLAAEMTPAEAFQAIAAACLRQFRRNEALFLAEPAPEPLHQMRVGLRRLRSALSIFRALLIDDATERLRGELRWISGVLGHARDLDVLILRAADVPEAVLAARDTAYAELLDALRSGQARAMMIDLLEWITLGEWLGAGPEDAPHTAEAFAADTLGRLRRRLKRRGRRLARLDDDARHEVRIVAKKLRYATEFFRPLFTGKKTERRYKAFRDALVDLQELLGHLNDIATAPLVYARLGVPPPEDAADAAQRATYLDDAEAAYEALIDTKRFW